MTISSDLISKLSSETQTAEAKKKNGNEIGKTEFLQMLVTQLKNQDPMNPMDGDQFAVNLAQFSQLEQLVSINEKIDKGSGAGDSASLASYLGHEVLLDKTNVTVVGGDGGMLRVDLPSDATDVSVDLLDSKGNKVDTVSLGAKSAGKQSLTLDNLSVPNGDYTYKVNMTTAAGGSTSVLAQVGGLVSGFIPGADPKLLIGGQEITPTEVTAVLAPPKN